MKMTNDQARTAIFALFQAFNLGGSGDEKRAKFAAYWSVLEELGADKVVYACNLAMRGEIGNPGFLPTAAELYQAVRPRSNKPPPIAKHGQDRYLYRLTGVLAIDGICYSPEEQESWAKGIWPPREIPQEKPEEIGPPTPHGKAALKLISEMTKS